VAPASGAIKPALDTPEAGRLDALAERKACVLVVDDQDLVHWGFRALLAAQPWVSRCLPARSPDAAVELARRHRPRLALVDALVGDVPGSELSGRLVSAAPTLSVVLMSATDDATYPGAQAVGAAGYVSKRWNGEAIVRALRTIAFGVDAADPTPQPMLSEREKEVLRLLAVGATNREVAARLYLSPHTVKDYTRAVYRKMNARNRAQAVVRAQRLGLLL